MRLPQDTGDDKSQEEPQRNREHLTQGELDNFLVDLLDVGVFAAAATTTTRAEYQYQHDGKEDEFVGLVPGFGARHCSIHFAKLHIQERSFLSRGCVSRFGTSPEKSPFLC